MDSSHFRNPTAFLFRQEFASVHSRVLPYTADPIACSFELMSVCICVGVHVCIVINPDVLPELAAMAPKRLSTPAASPPGGMDLQNM